MDAIPAVPEIDAGCIARVRDVLAGGHHGLEEDRRIAGQILARWPGADMLVRDANASHRRAACWAVTGGTHGFPLPPAAGVIFAACGYPVPGGFHAGPGAAQDAAPGALYCYSDASAAVAAYNYAELAVPDLGHVSVCRASAREPSAVLGCPQAEAMLGRGPVSVQVQLAAQWWDGEFCEWAVAEYARLLRQAGRAGSTLVLTLGIPGGAGEAEEFMADLGVVGTLHAHTEADVAGWCEKAGTVVTPDGVIDVRSRGLRWAADRLAAVPVPRRVVRVTAVVR